MKLQNSKLKIIFIFLLLVVGLVWGAAAQLPDGRLHLIFCDVGQGDAILAVKGSTQILIDGGPSEKVLSCLSSHLPFWDRQIELVVATHPEYDHLTGLVSVIQRYRILQIVSNSLLAESGVFQKFRAEVVSRQIPVHSPKAGEEIKIGGVTLKILYPPEKLGEEIVWKTLAEPKVLGLSTYTGNFNKTAIVTLLEFGNFQALLTGDVGVEEEEKFLPALGEVEVLKVAHHGSKYSTSESLLATTRPKLAVISVGANNRYGHPAPEVLERLRVVGAQIRRTDLEGEIELVSDGENWYNAN